LSGKFYQREKHTSYDPRQYSHPVEAKKSSSAH
jgi:hypothetical protein